MLILKKTIQSISTMNNISITYLTQQAAIKLDEELFTPEVGFTLDILMELAG